MLDVREQIQQRIDELTDEADRLRQALAALTGSSTQAAGRSRGRTGQRRGPGRAAQPSPGPSRTRAATRASSQTDGRRARSGRTKATVLEALAGGEAMTASDVAAKTGLGRASVSTTLSKLAQSGEVEKAQRGYRIAARGDAGEAPAA